MQELDYGVLVIGLEQNLIESKPFDIFYESDYCVAISVYAFLRHRVREYSLTLKIFDH